MQFAADPSFLNALRRVGGQMQGQGQLVAQVAPQSMNAANNYIYGLPGIGRIKTSQEKADEMRSVQGTMNLPLDTLRMGWPSP
jgi:hypothetical protein